MIITVEKLKPHITTDLSNEVLEAKLQALELTIRGYTHNNFQVRGIRTECPVMNQKLYTTYPHFKVNDTVEISNSSFSNGIYTIVNIADGFIELDKALLDESDVLVTKVEYPIDVVMGAINMLKWDIENRDKVGIQSETISRHSVTYYDQSASNTSMGYPVSLMGFLRPYNRARF